MIAMGYGAGGGGQRLGRPNDEEVDGVISEDALSSTPCTCKQNDMRQTLLSELKTLRGRMLLARKGARAEPVTAAAAMVTAVGDC
jgi:hypothetical protein